jgi:hypothetical protein
VPANYGLITKKQAGPKNIVYIDNYSSKSPHVSSAGDKELEEFRRPSVLSGGETCWVTENG